MISKYLYLSFIFAFAFFSCKEEKKDQDLVDKQPLVEETEEVVEEQFVKDYMEEENGVPVSGGELRVTMVDEPKHLNSAIQSGTPTGVIASQLFASLLRIDRNWDLHPNLAKLWEVSEDGKKVTFHLHEEAYFHDMERITVEDVAFSFEIIKSNHPFSSMLATVTNVEEVSEKTGVIHLSQPSPVLLTALASPMVPILPKHIYGDGQDIKSHPANLKPVGSGPFQFVNWESFNEIELKRFDNYFMEGQPYLDKVLFKFIPDKSKSVALENKSVDVTGFIAEKDILYLSSKENLAHLYKDSKGYGGIGSIMWLAYNLKKSPLNDVRVRQAIAYAIDRDLIAQTILGSIKHVATGPIYKGTPFYTDEYNFYDVDIEKANKLLDEAGYKKNEDGIRFTVSIDPIIQEISHKSGAYIADTLFRKIGIQVNLIDDSNFRKWAERVGNHEFDLAVDMVFNWGDPVIGVHRTYLSSNIRKGVIWSNTQSYINPEVDRILEEAEVENDFEKRKALYHEFQKIIAEELPIYPLTTIPYITVYDNRIKNLNNSIWGIMFPFDKVYWEESKL